MRDKDIRNVLSQALLSATAVSLIAAAACGAQEPAPQSAAPAAAAEPAAAPAAGTDQGAEPAAPAKGADQVTSLYELSARTIEGKDQDLSAYKGKVALVVNTASQCGFTPQYTGLEELWKKYKDKGVVVLGFPSNDFGGQEPGTDKEVLSFCQVRYGVSFPLFSKAPVKGSEASPIFRFLAAGHGEPKWNFHKYLVDKKGVVVEAFPSAVKPDDPALTAAIDKALAAQ